MSNIKKSAKHGNFVIEQYENNSVSIICDNTRQALRDIATELGMPYEADWNTQYFGHRVINFINGVDTTRKSTSETTEVVQKEFDENNLISDEDWNWWVSLSDSFKYVLLDNHGSWLFEKEIGKPFPTEEDGMIQIEVDLNDRAIMGNFVAKAFTGYHNEEGDYQNGKLHFIVFDRYNFNLEELGKLSHLKSLNDISLSRCKLDAIPQEIGKLTQLERLDLSHNELTADKLEVLSNLTNLTCLYLECNPLGGKAEDYEPLTKLTKLSELKLHATDLNSGTEGVLEKIAQLSELTILHLDGNKLGGQDFSPLSKLKNLRELYLTVAVTITDDFLKALATFPALEKLNLLTNNVAVNEFGIDLSQLTSLKDLELGNRDGTEELNAPSAELLSAIVTIPNLERLSLSTTSEYDRAEAAKAIEAVNFSNLIHLEELKLESVDISTKTLAEIGKLSNLKYLILEGGYSPENNAIEQFDCEQLVNLKRLGLSYRPVTAAVLAQIATLPNLEELNLIETSIDISWDEFALLKQMPKLKYLYLDRNNISPEKLCYLEDFAQVEKDYFSLSISEWGDDITETEVYKKLEALFEEKGFRLD